MTAQAIVLTLLFCSERSPRRLIGVVHARQADIKPGMGAPAALRKRERRARLSVRGAVIGAGAVSRNPLLGAGGGGSRNLARRVPRLGTGASRRVPRPGLRSVFRLPGLRAHISRLFRVSPGARPQRIRFRRQVGTQQPGASWISQWRLLETFIRHRKPPPGRILPSPLLLVTESGPAWIMPVAGIFMRRRHAMRPECMAPPRIARPQPGGESARIRAAFRLIGRRRIPIAPPRGRCRLQHPAQSVASACRPTQSPS